MKAEAVKRIQALKMYNMVASDFMDFGEVFVSESRGALYSVTDSNLKAVVEKFEKEQDVVVYHIVRSDNYRGGCYCLLFVDSDDSEWEAEMEDIKYNRVTAYLVSDETLIPNKVMRIGVKPANGGLVRSW